MSGWPGTCSNGSRAPPGTSREPQASGPAPHRTDCARSGAIRRPCWRSRPRTASRYPQHQSPPQEWRSACPGRSLRGVNSSSIPSISRPREGPGAPRDPLACQRRGHNPSPKLTPLFGLRQLRRANVLNVRSRHGGVEEPGQPSPSVSESGRSSPGRRYRSPGCVHLPGPVHETDAPTAHRC